MTARQRSPRGRPATGRPSAARGHHPTRPSARSGSGGAGAGVLQLQAAAGNKAVAGLLAAAKGEAVVARAPTVTPSTATLKALGDVQALKISELNSYANEQAGWAHEPSLAADTAERDKLIKTLEFARATSTAHLGDLLDVEVADTGLPDDVRKELRHYADAVDGSTTVGIKTKTAVLADARRDGAAVGKLEDKIPKPILNLTMGKNDKAKAAFANLVSTSHVDDFADYHAKAHPALEADDGSDTTSYLAMHSAEATDPASFVGTLPHVHNYHRFEADLLNALKTNEGDVSQSKPLALILHSGSDHNGAFHRDKQLTATVKHPRNLTIMVEGAAKLEDLGAAATDIAKRQGQGGKIGQLMLAGHGDARLIEMAGQQGADGTYKHDQVDLDKNKKRTEKFLKGLVANMAPGPDAHILLNACLNAADQVNDKLPKDPKKAKAAILKSLKANPSLASRLGTLAPGVGVEGNVSSVGAGQYMAIDPITGKPTGILHGTVASDPAATQTDRGEYIEKGREAEGCMRAVVALWALDNAECMKRIDARLAAPIGGWGDRVVHHVYGLLKASPNDISFFNRIVTSGGARGLSEFDSKGEQKPETIAGLFNAFNAAELKTLLTPLHAAAVTDAKLAMDVGWMIVDPSRRPTFMAELDTYATAKDAQEHLSDGWLAPSMPALLPMASAGAPSTAQAKLALYGVTGDRLDATAVAFLKKGAAATMHVAVPGGTTVDGLSGSDDEDAVLTTIGLKGSGAAPPSGATTVTANFDSDGDGTNDVFVESVTRYGAVVAFTLRLRQGPSLKAKVLDTIPAKEQLYVFGRSGDWLAVDRPGGGTGFVHKGWVKLATVA